MKRFGWLFWLLIWGAVPASYAQIAALTGYCNLGGVPAKTSGLSSTNNLQGVIPRCTVTAYLTGTQTLATIYSDGSSTPLANPFTATTSGQWTFFSSVNVGYDVVLSGGVSPNIYPSPVTLTGLYPGFSFSGGGGNPSFSAITSGVNSQASMTVGSGASLGHSGSGTIDSTSINGVAITGTPSAGQAPVATGPTSATWQAVAASFPPTQANTYLVGEGDSRMANSANAGPNSLPNQNFISQLILQSNFVNSAGSVDLAVGGSTCALMTARYATGAHNYRPGGSAVPGNVTKSMLILQIGVNDLRAGVSAIAEEACMTSYIANAIADGFTVVPMTVYWYASYTTTQQTQADIYNDWIRQLPASGQFPSAPLPFIFDYDLFFPPETNSPYYQNANTIIPITSVSVTSTVASFVTASQTLAANNIVLSTGYTGAAACLNNQYLTVSATGLSSTTFQAPIGCPNLTAGAGTLQLTGYDGLHMGAQGVALAAKNFNAVYTIAQTGTMLTQPNARSYVKPPGGYIQFDGCVHAGAMGSAPNCQSPGTLYSRLTSDPTMGLLILGNGNVYVRGTAGWETTMTSGGHYTITGGTGPFIYTGGAITAGVAGTTASPAASGALASCTNSGCSSGTVQLGNQTIVGNASLLTLSAPMQLASTSASLTCDATTGGTFQYISTGPTAKDIVQVCAHDASNVYAWRTIY